jgi:succinate dehydrogenase / fumarate reductase flavoprotein subunit
MVTSHHQRIVCNVLVIGTGAAGISAAIAAESAGSDVVLVGKRTRSDPHTVLAAGGINAALGTVDPEDSWQQHYIDTMREGYGLGDPRAVELLARESPDVVRELASWGCPFARTAEGKLDQRFFGAHKYRRTCYAGDYTGRAIIRTLVSRLMQTNVAFVEQMYIAELLVRDGRCFGAVGFDLTTGDPTVFCADAVVLAGGGHTRIWRRSSSRRDENTGDAMALAFRAGCSLGDMELVQFHPTGMVAPEEWAGTLVTEAVRGEGGRLTNARGERFMERYDPRRMELSTRDRVALANYSEILAGRGGPHGGVFLDISHRQKDFIISKLPRMYRQFLEAQMLDISRSPMEVAPTAHYSMGGVVVSPDTHATDVEGLFAAGEATCGVHGANRLGGNSLAETLVFGRRAGEAAARLSTETDAQVRDRVTIRSALDRLSALIRPGSEMARPLQRAIRDLMWEHCGVVRSKMSIEAGLATLASIAGVVDQVDVRPSSEGYQDLGVALDLRGSIMAAEATLRSARERRESRGAHQRSDYPDMLPCGQNTRVTPSADGGMEVQSVPVPKAAKGLPDWEAGDELVLSGRLLE